MKILAFLQNMWVRNPERVKAMIAREPEIRPRLIEYALFAGCLTGRRLKAALGEELCEQIIWEEASPVITGNASDAPPPDREHIKTALELHKPDVVICFTKPAFPVLDELIGTPVWLIGCVHPACRQPDTMERLRMLRKSLDILLSGKSEPEQMKAAQKAGFEILP